MSANQSKTLQSGKAADPTISRNAMPDTDDSVLEAMDEATPGTGILDARASQPANPQRGKTPHADKAA